MADYTKGEYAKQNRNLHDKMIPSQDKSFVDDTYAEMLKKSGRKIALSSVDGHAESKRMTRTRPEYTRTMKDLNTEARFKVDHEEA